MQPAALDRYLARIGFVGARSPTPEVLSRLQRAHLRSVVFDALDCLTGPEPSLDEDALFAKVVERGRGGFCFELNGLFAALLLDLGFDVTMCAARPFGNDGSLAPERAHLTLVVALEQRWLVDVGFGPSFMEPLALDDPHPQQRDDETWVVTHDGTTGSARVRGAGRPWGYQFSLVPRRHEDFADQCRLYATAADSPFKAAGSCWKRIEGGWIGVRRDKLVNLRGLAYSEEPFADDDAWKAALFEHFGYRL